MVRPILEYGNVVWSNGTKKLLNKIENVQRKFTKHVKGIYNLSYEKRLKKLQLPSIEYRQIRGDMLQVWLLKGFMTVNRLNQSLNLKIQIDLEVINIKSINMPLINQSSKSFSQIES